LRRNEKKKNLLKLVHVDEIKIVRKFENWSSENSREEENMSKILSEAWEFSWQYHVLQCPW